jgi:SAM-dependent methyltransferase
MRPATRAITSSSTLSERIVARTCRCCGAPLDGDDLDLGLAPICNRFSLSDDAPRHPLVLTMCNACRLIQLRAPPAVSTVMPRAPWIRYNEPEAHLDEFVDRLFELASMAGRPNPTAMGLGPFEAPLLRRLAARGVSISAPDLLAADADGMKRDGRFPYLETWQARLDPQTLGTIAETSGRVDLVSCRYLLEHCHEPIAALRGFRQLLKPEGVLALEVPGSGKFLAARDYCFPWEEHVCYFVEETLAAVGEAAGYEFVKLFCYPGRLEDALIGLFRVRRTPRGGREERAPGLPKDQFSAYRAGFAETRAFVRRRLAAVGEERRERIALVGLGHQGMTFVNVMGLNDLIGVAADDDANKHGYFPPGLDAPVISSSDLIKKDQVKMCLLAVSPSSEKKVREKLAPLEARGAQLRSIYAGVSGSILDGRPS